MITRYLASLSLFAVVALSSCKSATEKRGDEHLKAGRLKNAMAMYTKAEQKGNVSKEFNDNFALAYIRMLAQIAKNDPMNGAILGYKTQIPKYLANTQNTAVVSEFINALIQVAKGQIKMGREGNYSLVLEGFRALELAEEWSKKHSVEQGTLKAAKTEIEKDYVPYVLGLAKEESNSVAREYILLEAEVVMPDNAELQEALAKVRLENRGHFLIFEAVGVENPSPKVNKFGYIMAFPSLRIARTETRGEIQFWNSTGNNTTLDINNIKLFSKDGKEVVAKQTGNSSCTVSDPMAKTRAPFRGTGKLLDEGQCSIMLSFSYGADFQPHFVEYRDGFGVGRKFL